MWDKNENFDMLTRWYCCVEEAWLAINIYVKRNYFSNIISSFYFTY